MILGEKKNGGGGGDSAFLVELGKFTFQICIFQLIRNVLG